MLACKGKYFQLLRTKIAQHPKMRIGFWGFLFFAVTAVLFGFSFIEKGLSLKEGQISPSDVYAPRTVVYIDEAETERLKNEAASRVEKIYREDAQASALADEKLKNIYTKIRELQQAEIPQKDRIAALRDYIGQITGASDRELKELSDASLHALLQLSEKDLEEIESMSRNFLQEELRYGLKEEALQSARENLVAKVSFSQLDSSLQPGVAFILTHSIRPNLVFDRKTYEKMVFEAREDVHPVQRTIKAGQIIVRKGEPVESSDIAALRQLGILRSHAIWPSLLGLIIFVFLLGGLILFYIWKFRPNILLNEQFLVLYGLLFVLMLLIAKGITVLKISSQPEMASMVGYLVPLAGGAMLVTVLLDAGLAVFTSFIFSIIVGMMMDGQMSFVLAGLFGSLAGIYSVSTLSDRTGLIRAGIFVSVTNAVVIFTLGLLNGASASNVIMGAVMGVLNGFISSVMTLGFIPYLESAFGITSSVRLLELANPNQPLLKRLLMEAPGTYHHSILVGNLAEAAAQAVHADPLLVRVGAYYHDIGKLKRPYFFIENQVARENPHEKIAPSLSTLIITSHIKDGLELAREYRLPQNVQEIIAQHHGTSLVTYFYQRALESDRPELVAESDFRYDSVKPQSKEAALVMLADSVEAAVRALQKPTPGRLEGLTRKIIKEKLHDGQLDECDLTFKDLNRIAVAFVRVLTGIFHSRIEYPETMISEIERRRSRSAVVNQ